MSEQPPDALVLTNRHTGERLELRRVANNGETWLSIKGTLPPRRQGPPLHVHHFEDEEGSVIAGTLSVLLDGRNLRFTAGQSTRLPVGSVHRWWNDSDETLVVEGCAKPLVDLDRYLSSMFEIINEGEPDRPSLFYMAHVSWRHRRTQSVVLMPRPVQAVAMPLIVLVGTLLGRYRGSDWPGSPARSKEAP